MRIISWNVAGLRAKIKKNEIYNIIELNPDIICIQETKADENQVKIPEDINKIYPFRYWSENKGITQKKGFSGTSIWLKVEPIQIINLQEEFDQEGRIGIIELEEYYLINVYVVNSQEINSERCKYRNLIWDKKLEELILKLKKTKEVIICGDFNVANEDIDIYNPEKLKNKTAGFLDCERENFKQLLDNCNLIDIYRYLNPREQTFSYWDQRVKKMRETNKGWRIDYFLITEKLRKKIKRIDILVNIFGSDHAPLILEI